MAPEPVASIAPQLARRLVEVTDEAVLVLDSSGVVRSANQAASRALGLPLTAFVGRAVEALHDRFPLLRALASGWPTSKRRCAPMEGGRGRCW